MTMKTTRTTAMVSSSSSFSKIIIRYVQMIATVLYLASSSTDSKVLISAFSIAGNTNTNAQTIMIQKIKKAMSLSTQGQVSISSAYHASYLWEDILSKKNQHNNYEGDGDVYIVPTSVKKICNALYAATLVRIGRDDTALKVYDETLDLLLHEDNNDEQGLSSNFDWPLWMDIRIAKGEALQRLIQYQQARCEFYDVWSLVADDTNIKVGIDIGNGSSGKMGSVKDIDFHRRGTKIDQSNPKFSSCAYKAALCSLRLDDLQSTQGILRTEYERISSFKEDETARSISSEIMDLNPDIIGMLGVVQIEQMQRESNDNDGKVDLESDVYQSSIKLLENAALIEGSPSIYQWFYDLLTFPNAATHNNNNDNDNNKRKNPVKMVMNDEKMDMDIINTDTMGDQLLRISSINQSPYDDPCLVHLDDKVLLHKLLSRYYNNNNTTRKFQFWPTGFVFPNDKAEFMKNFSPVSRKGLESTKWVLKQRAGYGSHGNKIVSTNDALELLLSSRSTKEEEELLCQKLIDPTLCYQGRRFSLRVYVIYFSQGQWNGSKNGTVEKEGYAYLSKTGLMKIALLEEEINESESVNDVYMTNSGRMEGEEGEEEIQKDFIFLKRYIDEVHGQGSFETVWAAIKDSVSSVMEAYVDYKCTYYSSTHRNSTTQGIFGSVPKIMGFDYILDASLDPWLLEVNRFPGLQPRNDADRTIKYKLIEDTWKLAAFEADLSNKNNDKHDQRCWNFTDSFDRLSINTV